MNSRKKLLACILSTGLIASSFISIPSIKAADNVQLFNDGFEAGTDAWFNFGSCKVTSVDTDSHNGTHSLLVSNRTSAWQGAACTKSDDLKAGTTYNFSAYVMYKAGSDTEDLRFQLKYTDANGKDQYTSIATATVSKGVWTKLENTSYTIPSGATNILIYFETPKDLIDFYIDDISAIGNGSGVDVTAVTPLKKVFSKYFKIGCAATPSEISSNVAKTFVEHHFNSLTLGNELKPDYVLDQAACQQYGNNVNPQVSLDKARSVLQFCEDNNISIRGHVLVWHSQTPSWFFKENFSDNGAVVSKDIMNQRLENYIKNLMGKLKTEFPTLNIYAYDVVNEAFQENGVIRKGGFDASSGESAWTLVYGDDSYIDQAFTYAKKYAPANCKLFYNDYNEYTPAKRDAICNMANRLKNKNIIDGIGMQSHLSVSWPDVTLYKEALQKYSSLGLEIQVTELDLTQDDQSDAGIKAQTDKYTSIMQALVDAKRAGANITSVVFWGVTDGTSWRKEGHPLLFDANYNAKPVLYSIENLIPKSDYENPCTLGDLNSDGKINTLDLSLMKRGLLNGFTDSTVKLVADMNKDGNVNSIDLSLLKRQLLSN